MIEGTVSKLQIILCASDAAADAYRRAGFRSVRAISGVAGILVPVGATDRLDPSLEAFSDFVLDLPDTELRDDVAVRIDDAKCRWIDWQGSSVESVFASHGPEVIRSVVRSARPMWVDEVCLMSDIPDPGVERVYETGFDALDRHGLRLKRGMFLPVVGPWGSGKSTLVRQLVCNLYRLHGWKTLITAFEERVKPLYQRDLRRHLIGEEFVTSNGEVLWRTKYASAVTPEDIAAADAKIQDGFRFLLRKSGVLLDAERIIRLIRQSVRVYGTDVVVIDPMNEIDHRVPRGMSKTDYIGEFIMLLKQMAYDYNLVMIVCVHPPKDAAEKRSTAGQLMTLVDAADSANYGNKADMGWCVWRSNTSDNAPTYLHVDKVKDHETMGKPTVAKLVFNSLTGQFAIPLVGYAEVKADMMGD